VRTRAAKTAAVPAALSARTTSALRYARAETESATKPVEKTAGHAGRTAGAHHTRDTSAFQELRRQTKKAASTKAKTMTKDGLLKALTSAICLESRWN
jgi:hypothetical protein